MLRLQIHSISLYELNTVELKIRVKEVKSYDNRHMLDGINWVITTSIWNLLVFHLVMLR